MSHNLRTNTSVRFLSIDAAVSSVSLGRTIENRSSNHSSSSIPPIQSDRDCPSETILGRDEMSRTRLNGNSSCRKRSARPSESRDTDGLPFRYLGHDVLEEEQFGVAVSTAVGHAPRLVEILGQPLEQADHHRCQTVSFRSVFDHK